MYIFKDVHEITIYMHDSKLLKILKTLSEEEVRRFHKFIRSPYYSYKKHCVPFFEYVRRYHPEYTSGKLSKENVFYHLFPDRQFQSQKIRHVMTDIVNLLEDFLIAEQIRKRDFERKKLLRDAYGQRDLYDYFEKSTDEISKDLEALPYRNRFYQYETLINQEEYFFHSLTEKHLVKEHYLEQMDESLDNYYKLSKVYLRTEMEARSHILSKKYDDQRPLGNIDLLESSDLPEFSLLMDAMRLYKIPENESYFKLKESFFAIKDQLSFNDKNYIFHHLLNFAIRRGNEGHIEFTKQTLTLYKLALDEQIVGSNGKIRDANFTNICAVGIKAKEFTWVESFIKEYSLFLNTEIKEDATQLCTAFLAYGMSNFVKADKLISTFAFRDPFYQIRGKMLSLRALLELFIADPSYFELLQYNALSFEKFIRRNKTIGKKHKEVYLNFIQYLKTLANLSINLKLDSDRADSLINKIEGREGVINRDWLIQKVKELKAKGR